jgi:hypothetical protein
MEDGRWKMARAPERAGPGRSDFLQPAGFRKTGSASQCARRRETLREVRGPKIILRTRKIIIEKFRFRMSFGNF